MRKISSGMFMTLDGVIEAPETWNPPYYDDELNDAVLPRLADADLHLYGTAFLPYPRADVSLACHVEHQSGRKA